MDQDSGRAHAADRAAPVYSPALLPLMQSLLATLANIDAEHEHEVERATRSSPPASLKAHLLAKLSERHRERRALRRATRPSGRAHPQPLGLSRFAQFAPRMLSSPARFRRGMPNTLSVGWATQACLVLQLSLRVGFALMPLPMTVLGHGLMDASPQRPAEEMIKHDAGGTLQAAHELADLAHAEGDRGRGCAAPFCAM